jgi:hypothetical protein
LDGNFLDLPPALKLPLPVVKLGASIGIDRVEDLPASVDSLLDPSSDLCREVKAKMGEYYPNDGKNAERVAAVVNESWKTSEEPMGEV